MSGISGLPGITAADLPAEVRGGTKAQQDAYKAAMGFEQVLVRQMVQEITKSSPELSEGVHADAIADAMTAALQSAGGLGLAKPLAATIAKASS
jgi:Rod binding domain-containing protein